jgi:hypothetical protein
MIIFLADQTLLALKEYQISRKGHIFGLSNFVSTGIMVHLFALPQPG